MRNAIFLILLPLLTTCLSAQTNLDSLYALWEDKTHSDSIRTYAFASYIEYGYLLKGKPDSAFFLAEEMIAFGQEKKYPNARARGYYIQANSFYFRDSFPKTLDYLERSLKISRLANYKNGIAYTLNRMGRIYQIQSDYLKALDYYQQSLEIREEIGNKEGVSIGLNNIGRIYSDLGNFTKSLDYYQQSLKIREDISDKNGIANSLHNIGSIYFNQSDYAKALDYYQRSLKIKKEIGNKRASANSLHNIGSVFHSQGNYEQALESYRQSIKIREELGGKNGMAYSLNNMGATYRELGNFPQALEHYQHSLKIREELGNKRTIANSLQGLGQVYADLGKFRDAIDNCQRSLSIGEELGALVLQRDACSCLHETYKKTGMSTEALKYHEQLTMIKDSIFNEANVKKLTQLEMQYEFDKKELSAKLAYEKEVLELENKNAKVRTQRNGIIGISVFFVILGSFGYNLLKIRKDRNDKKAFAEALILAQESERKRIARDLHDGVGQSLLLIKTQLASTHEMSAQNNQLISDTLEEVRSISRDLHPFQLEKFGLTTAVTDVIEKVERSTELFITKEIENIDGIFSSKEEINYFRVIQEALNNIVKHAEATAAKVIIKNSATMIETKIMDNGKGFDHELTIIKTRSLGLRTMNERLSSLGSQLKIEANAPAGTVINFSIPVNS